MSKVSRKQLGQQAATNQPKRVGEAGGGAGSADGGSIYHPVPPCAISTRRSGRHQAAIHYGGGWVCYPHLKSARCSICDRGAADVGLNLKGSEQWFKPPTWECDECRQRIAEETADFLRRVEQAAGQARPHQYASDGVARRPACDASCGPGCTFIALFEKAVREWAMRSKNRDQKPTYKDLAGEMHLNEDWVREQVGKHYPARWVEIRSAVQAGDTHVFSAGFSY